MGRQPNLDLDDLDDEDTVRDNRGWRPLYLDSKDDEPQWKSYHAERRRTCFPTTHSKSRGEFTPPAKKDPPRPKKSKRTQQKTKAVKEHKP
jgi:hypothetical protein